MAPGECQTVAVTFDAAGMAPGDYFAALSIVSNDPDEHEVVVPVTGGKLDLGPWQQIFYYEFDGRRKKRVILKALGA